MRGSTFTSKYLSSLSEVVQSNTERSIFVTNKLNLLNCYMEEFVVTNIKQKYIVYLLKKEQSYLFAMLTKRHVL